MTTTPKEMDQLIKALGAQQRKSETEKQLAWVQSVQQQAIAQSGLGPSYPSLGSAAGAATPRPFPVPSAAAQKLYRFISESIGEIASQWVEVVLVRRELLPKLMNMPKGLPLGAFVGDAGVVVVQFDVPRRTAAEQWPDARPPIGTTAVYVIPQSILDELTAEDVAVALDGTSK